MTDATVVIHIDKDILADLQASNYNLNWGIPITVGSKPFTHTSQGSIASKDLKEITKFNWTVPESVKYEIAFHTKKHNETGDFIPSLSDTEKEIARGQVYEISKTDDDRKYKVDVFTPAAEEKWITNDEIGFSNHVLAAPMLFRIDLATGKATNDIFGGNFWVPGQGAMNPPKDPGEISIWFDFIKGGETTSRDESDKFRLLLQPAQETSVVYNADGEWSL